MTQNSVSELVFTGKLEKLGSWGGGEGDMGVQQGDQSVHDGHVLCSAQALGPLFQGSQLSPPKLPVAPGC